MDYQNYASINNNKNARNTLQSIIRDNNIIDTFRYLNGTIQQYTWRRLTPLQQARLDFFLTSNNLSSKIRKSTIDSCYKSDHSIIDLEIIFEDVAHGKGLWKFNNSLLKDIDYLNCINTLIENIKLQYCIPIYNIENIENIHNSTIQFVINDQLFLETLLMEIRGKTISFSSYKAKQNKNHKSNLIKKIDIQCTSKIIN